MSAEFLLVFEGNGRACELIGRGLFASVGEAFGIGGVCCLKRRRCCDRGFGSRLARHVFQSLGVGAADVGNGKQVECVEVFACGNTAAEGLEDMGILDVFFLGNGGHEQVVFNQPCEEVAFFVGVVVVGGELLGVFDAFFGVIAAHGLWRCRATGRRCRDMWSWVGLHDGAGLGHFVAMGFDGETAHIADDGQDVVVYGVNMEEVVLEQAGDFFPMRGDSGQVRRRG